MYYNILLVTEWRSKVILIIYICCSGRTFIIILGSIRRDGNENGAVIVTATQTTVHPNYNSRNLYNDIAVIRLPSPVAFTGEYCHCLMNIKIILFILKQINCFLFTAQTFSLFNSSMLLKVYQSFEYSKQCCNISKIQRLSQLKL